MAATNVTEVARMDDGVKGGRVKFYTFNLDLASIAAAAQGTDTIAVPDAKVGDLVFINPEALEANIAVVGGKVTSTGVVTVYVNNMYDATTAKDSGNLKYNMCILHLS